MNKLIFLISLIIGLLSFNIKASNLDLFQYDENIINEKFQSLNNLEIFINQNQGITLTEIQANNENDGLIVNLDKNGINNSLNIFTDPPLGIPSFMWGCCFGWVGIIIVYITCNDPIETNKALKGFVVTGVAGVAIYAIVFAILLNTTPATY